MMSAAAMSLLVILVLAIVLVWDRFPIDMVALAGAIACGLLGLIKYPDIFIGFGGTSTILLVSMMVVGSSLFYTGLAKKISMAFLKVTGDSENGLIITVTLLGALLSSICNNIGVVMTLMPIVLSMCKPSHISPSRLLMPMSYGAAVGAMLTLVGTVTSVIASAVLNEMTGKSIGFVELAWLGVPLTLATVVYMVTLGKKLIPNYDIDMSKIEIVDDTMADTKKMWISGIILIAVVIGMAFAPKSFPLYMISSIGALILILTGCISTKQAYSSISWTTVVICGAMMAVCGAVSKTGGAKLIADWVVSVIGGNANPYVITAVFFLVVMALTQFLSNISTMALMAPIAISIANSVNVDPLAMAIVVAVGVNAAYLTPVGTQSLTVIAEPGHYKFTDFFKVGLPIAIINFILVMIIVPLKWF